MKPELIFINEKDGMVTMSREDLEQIVERAYRAGQADASTITTTPWTIGSPTWADGAPRPYKPIEVTCGTGGNRT